MLSSRPKMLNQNLTRTLPITCQICLCKVKDPTVCPNLHTFCSFCIDVWLEKNKQCPTCRVPITLENPCRRILGGVENLDDADMLKPSDFSHSSIRKARYLSFFQQYEDEIARLLKYVDSVNLELTKLKESSKYANNSSSMLEVSSSNPDLLQTLKGKLQQAQTALSETTIERDNLKEINKKLDSENSILMQDTIRLKLIINEKTSQMSNKYTVAALETKIECYEKEIKQLQKALEKSDRYIAELERSEPSNAPNLNSRQHSKDNQPSASFVSDSFVHSKVDFKPNDSRNVKFADKTDTIPPINKQIVKSSISKDNFYGSPSKNSPSKSKQPSIGIKAISSFSDRLKVPNDSALLLEDSNFKLSTKASHGSSDNILFSNSDKPTTSVYSQNSQSFLFSPMKRLRLDEVVLEKPDETSVVIGSNTLTSSTDTDANMTTPPRNTTLPFNSNSQLLNNDVSPQKQKSKQPEAETTTVTLNNSSTEFSDCLKLLNQAEKKVQKRLSPSTVNLNNKDDFTMPNKYFQASGNFVNNPNENAENFVNPNTATYNTLTNGATMTYSGSNVSSINSMNFGSNSMHFQGGSTNMNSNMNNIDNTEMIQNYGYQNMSYGNICQQQQGPDRNPSIERTVTYHQMQNVHHNDSTMINDFKRNSEVSLTRKNLEERLLLNGPKKFSKYQNESAKVLLRSRSIDPTLAMIKQRLK